MNAATRVHVRLQAQLLTYAHMLTAAGTWLHFAKTGASLETPPVWHST